MKGPNHLLIQGPLLLMLTFFACPVHAQAALPGAASDTILMDPAVRYRKLPNGFTYYIRSLPGSPEIEMRLVTKAGSFHEDNDQLGLAHLLEHVGCRGTVHFPGGIAEYIEGQGLLVGNNINATTDGTHTLYYLRFTRDHPEVFENSLLILRDWANGMVLDSAEINAERGVVLQEYAMKHSVELETIQSLLQNRPGHYYSQQREKMLENIKNFNHSALRRFYNDWYRPDLQAAIIVGNVDADEMEARVMALFSTLTNPENPKQLKEASVGNATALTGRNQFIPILSKDRSGIQANIFMKKKGVGIPDIKVTVTDYKKYVLDALHNEMIRRRWEKYNADHLALQHIHQHISRALYKFPLDAFHIQIQVRDADLLRASLMAAIKGATQVQRFGFTETELAAAKHYLLDKYNTQDEQHARKTAAKFTDHFVWGAAAPAPDDEQRLITMLTTGITLAEVNETISAWIDTRSNMDVVILANETTALPDEDEVHQWIREANSTEPEPYPQPVYPDTLSLIPPDNVNELQTADYQQEAINAIGVTKLTLQNGVRVILKPFKPAGHQHDLVLLHGFSPGGALLYPEEDHASAHYAASIVKHGGAGELDAAELKRYLRDKTMEVYPYIDDTEEGIRGSANRQDVEALLQLVYLYFTAPRKDQDAYQQWMGRISNRKRNAFDRFMDTIQVSTRCKKTLLSASVKNVSLDKAYRIYQERFANARDFTFVITGNVALDVLTSLVIKYLGNLPGRGINELRKDAPECQPEGIVTTTVQGSGRKAMVRLFFSGLYTFTPKNNVTLDVLANVIEIMLTNRLRRKEGGVYGVSATVQYAMHAQGYYKFIVNFQCDPTGKERMIEAMLEELNDLRLTGPAPDTLQKAKEQQKQKLQYNLLSNSFWQQYLESQEKAGHDPVSILKHAEFIDSLEPVVLKDAAIHFLSHDNYRLFVLL